MEIRRITVGDMYSNVYIVFEKEGGNAVLIDAGDDADIIISRVKKLNLTLTHIILTHGHFDHIGAVKETAAATGAKICIHRNEATALTSHVDNLSHLAGLHNVQQQADILLDDGDIITSGNLEFEIIHTPGHSMGSICIKCGKALFTGDTLFKGNVGRADLPGSNDTMLAASLEKVKKLDGDYNVYGGHGASSTLDRERQHNPFLNGSASIW
ncbi:MAG: MBL fold metallo-hydrolase [Christensenellales bacterium]|jgi:hydroxyacylglutathione hydrolase